MVECAWKIEAGKIDVEVVIPPNATALVTLPGNDAAPVEVGSGSWHWAIPYQDPDARAPYSVDDVIEEIMSDTGVRTVVMDAISRSKGADFLGMILQNYRDLTLRQALGMIPKSGDLLTVMIDALAKLGEQSKIAK
jgi:alpha-L-rhamnosidase